MPKADREAMFAEVDLHGMNDSIDRGGAFRETIDDWAELYPKWRDLIRGCMTLDRHGSPVIDRSVHLLRALRARGVPVFALSNFGIDSFVYAQSTYRFLRNSTDRRVGDRA